MVDAVGADSGRWANPRWCYPEYPPGSVVEIRVHGVGGEPPSRMTRDPHPVLVGGSDVAGFFRARNPVVEALGAEGAGADGQPEGTAPGRRRPLHVREVLSWGGQTSGTTRHALWVLLLPFALFNVAGRMHRPGAGWRPRLHRATCRVLALTMTLAVTVLVGGVAFDLLAIQCGAWGETCLGDAGGGRALLAPLRRFDGDVAGRLGIAALLPTAVVLGLWYAGRYRTGELEGSGEGEPAAPETAEPTALADPDFWRNAWPASRLRGLHASAAFAVITATLALSLHVVTGPADGGAPWSVVAGLAALVAVAATATAAPAAVATPGPEAGFHVWLSVLRFAALAPLGFLVGLTTLGRVSVAFWRIPETAVHVGLVTLGVALVVVWLGPWAWLPEGRRRGTSACRLDPTGRPGGAVGWMTSALALGSVLLGWGGGGLVDRLLPPLSDGGTPRLGELALSWRWLDRAAEVMPGVFGPAYLPLVALVVVQTLLLATLLVASVGRTRPLRNDTNGFDRAGPVPGNLAAVVVALLSLFLLTAVGAGLHALVLDALGDRSAAVVVDDAGDPVDIATRHGYEREAPLLTLPWWHAITALTVLALPVVALVAGGVWWWRRRSAPEPGEIAEVLQPAYAGAGLTPPPDPDDPDDARRLREIGGQWVLQRFLRDAGVLLLWVVAATLVLVLLSIAAHVAGGPVGRAVPLTTLAVWMVSAVPLVGIGLLRRGLRDREARRGVGRLWDVLTFWPRVTHPFAPPAYGEALVPLLTRKLEWLLTVPQRYGVVLAGHSQGSVVSLAAVAQLGVAADRPRLALVSYGSPIAILYERYFPATLRTPDGGHLLTDVSEHVRSWHHLFSLTEPFAYPFWTVVPDAPAQDLRNGWRVSRLLPRVDEDCPTCSPDTPAVVSRRELVVRDPDRWRLPDGAPTEPLGHSSYHRHPDVDRHLHRIATSIAPDPSEVSDEGRAGRWWRAAPDR